MDRRLTCKHHNTSKIIKLKLEEHCWLIGNKSKMTLENKILIYRIIINYMDVWIRSPGDVPAN